MKKILIIISSIILLIFLTGFTKALYTSNSIWDYYLNSKGFYFESDYNKSISVNNFYDGSDISFILSNSLKDKYTEDDISYTISCEASNGICKVDGMDSYSAILKGGSSNSEKIDISADFEGNDTEVLVIIKSTSPYKKTIKHKIILHKDNSIIGTFDYDFINYDNYSVLNISNYYNQDKCFDIKWETDDIKVSNSNIDVIGSDTNGYINEFRKNVSKGETISIKFYNQSDNVYTKDIFKILECPLEG